jgi:hypothetical protein
LQWECLRSANGRSGGIGGGFLFGFFLFLFLCALQLFVLLFTPRFNLTTFILLSIN